MFRDDMPETNKSAIRSDSIASLTEKGKRMAEEGGGDRAEQAILNALQQGGTRNVGDIGKETGLGFHATASTIERLVSLDY